MSVKPRTTIYALPFLFLFLIISSATLKAENAADNAYFSAELGAVFFDLPEYQDGYGVVGLEPVSGPYFAEADDHNGSSLTLTGGILTDKHIDWLNSTVFLEASGFYSKSNENANATLGSDPDGNNIRFALFDGSNGFNSSDGGPLNYKLRSEIDYYGVRLDLGLESELGSWTIRTQVGPQLLRLKQDYTLYGVSINDPNSTYNRYESLDSRYRGIRFAVSADKHFTNQFSVETELGISALALRTRYKGQDEHYSDGQSQQNHSLHKGTYSADLKLAARYQVTPAVAFGLNIATTYINDVPEIKHATGATSNNTFVPSSLDTDTMLVTTVGVELTSTF